MLDIGNILGDVPTTKKRKKNKSNSFGIDFSADTFGIGMNNSRKQKETERDTRRTFSPTQRNEIWDKQKGKCAGAHCRHASLLRSATHFDHIIPWEKGGKTVVSNGQAFCPTCHTLKSQKDRLRNVDKKRKTKTHNNSSIDPISGLPVNWSKTDPWRL